MEYSYLEDDEIERLIIEETNKEIQELEKDFLEINYIFTNLNEMIYIQGDRLDQVNEKIETSERDVSISVRELADVEEMVFNKNKIIRYVSIMVGSLGLGAFGFIAGPIIGIGTLLSGAGIGGGIVYASNKLGK